MPKFPRMQFSIRTLLGVVLLVGFCLTGDRAYSRWFQHKYSQYHMYLLLRDRIHNGDSVQEVSQLFQTAEKVDPADQKIQKIWSSHSWTIEAGDEMWRFGHQSAGVVLQFRDGRLVNSSGRDFNDPAGIAALNRHPVPPIYLRYGIWPICVVALVIGGSILIAIDNRAPRESTSLPH